ncbi:MAG: pentapeptide repeat-containing protein, partial [Solirubrobacterales bacterium]
MRSFSKVFCLSLLSVALLVGLAQARTVLGCEIRPKTNCAGANLRGANLGRANLRGADLRGA